MRHLPLDTVQDARQRVAVVGGGRLRRSSSELLYDTLLPHEPVLAAVEGLHQHRWAHLLLTPLGYLLLREGCQPALTTHHFSTVTGHELRPTWNRAALRLDRADAGPFLLTRVDQGKAAAAMGTFARFAALCPDGYPAKLAPALRLEELVAVLRRHRDRLPPDLDDPERAAVELALEQVTAGLQLSGGQPWVLELLTARWLSTRGAHGGGLPGAAVRAHLAAGAPAPSHLERASAALGEDGGLELRARLADLLQELAPFTASDDEATRMVLGSLAVQVRSGR